ncbi:DUF2878 domain-containing protein [Candidatus Protochlamydia phocaeensis]|uniref:DUF2878 domain-containing protein n=1 Tax=Candidatus Protochlamydia phocaeensis TaxID=1414722 RepID=UPI0008391F05|nr:DUF2878 domain-containing protein [Candidatus Protochlamydia phocaeensis]
MSPRFLNRTLNTGLFYFAWVLCLQEAASGGILYGLLTIFLIIVYHLYRSSYRKADSLLLLFVVLIGPLSDSIYKQTGLIHYHAPFHSIAWLPPLWIFLLWGLFAVNINLFSWLKKKWVLATVLGAVGGPASYLSAERLGTASLLKPMPFSLLIIGGVWAVFFPSLVWLNERFKDWFKGK